MAPAPVHCFSITFVGDVIDVIVTCKDEEDLIKNESARVVTRFSPL